MDPKRSTPSADAIIARLAAHQSNVVCTGQLLAAGISATQIKVRVRDGRLRKLHRGVFLVGAVSTALSYPQAALFASKPDGVLGCWSAIALWGLRSYPDRAHPWILVPRRRRIDRPRILIRRVDLAACDLRVRRGLRTVSPARAILDCARETNDPYLLESLVAEADFRGLASIGELQAVLARYRGGRGVRALRSVVDLPGGPKRTRSDGERALLRLFREHGVDGFETNARVPEIVEPFRSWRPETLHLSRAATGLSP